jgi:hypothetical protein
MTDLMLGLIVFVLVLIWLTIGLGFWPAVGIAIGIPIGIVAVIFAVACVMALLVGLTKAAGHLAALPIRLIKAIPVMFDTLPRRIFALVVIIVSVVVYLLNIPNAYPAENITILRVKPNPNVMSPSTVAPPPKPKYLILPPVEYDQPYEGELTIETVANHDELRAKCGDIVKVPWTLGCAFRRADSCRVYLIDEKLMRAVGWWPRSCSATR